MHTALCFAQVCSPAPPFTCVSLRQGCSDLPNPFWQPATLKFHVRNFYSVIASVVILNFSLISLDNNFFMKPFCSNTIYNRNHFKNCIDIYLIYRGRHGTPLQYSCLENPMDGGAWKAAVQGVTEGWTRMSDFTFTFHFHAFTFTFKPTPMFLPGESQGRGSLVGCRLRGRTASDTTEET